MPRLTPFIIGALLLAGTSVPKAGQQRSGTTARVTLYEGARLITGDGGAPIENSAFLVEDTKFSRVGRKGELQAPPGAARVDLTGKTVIPGLVDAHSHIGYMKNLTSGAQNYTRENILDHMHRFAYFGVAASQAMGSDFGEMPFQLRDEILAGKYPDAARFLTAGRGLAPLSEISPDNMRQAAYPVTTPEGARADVQELAHPQGDADQDVGGRSRRRREETAARSCTPPSSTRRTRTTCASRCTPRTSQVAKDLLRAGIDVFAHMISDVDDELVALFKQHPNASVISALGGPHRAIYAPWLNPVHPLILETVLPAQIDRLRNRFPEKDPAQLAKSTDAWNRLARGLTKLHAAGVTIGVGTDGGGQQGDQFIGWTMHAELENLVMAGLTPSQALVAATRTSAAILGQDDLGAVAPGKSADFVVLDANPLDDITNTRRISRVYLRGHLVDREKLRASFAGNGTAN